MLTYAAVQIVTIFKRSQYSQLHMFYRSMKPKNFPVYMYAIPTDKRLTLLLVLMPTTAKGYISIARCSAERAHAIVSRLPVRSCLSLTLVYPDHVVLKFFDPLTPTVAIRVQQ